MQIYVGRIAPIANVSGTCLLPELHEHGSNRHVHSTCRTTCEHLTGSQEAPKSNSTKHSHHHHSHSDAARHKLGLLFLEHQSLMGFQFIGSGPATAVHDHGLRAICISLLVSKMQLTLIPTSVGTTSAHFCTQPAPTFAQRLNKPLACEQGARQSYRAVRELYFDFLEASQLHSRGNLIDLQVLRASWYLHGKQMSRCGSAFTSFPLKNQTEKLMPKPTHV